MVSTGQNRIIYAGDTNSITFTSTLSLTNASVVWGIEEIPGSGSVLRKTTDDDIAASGSVMTISLSPSDTINLAGKYYQEVEVTDASSNITTIVTGILEIKKSGVSL